MINKIYAYEAKTSGYTQIVQTKETYIIDYKDIAFVHLRKRPRNSLYNLVIKTKGGYEYYATDLLGEKIKAITRYQVYQEMKMAFPFPEPQKVKAYDAY